MSTPLSAETSSRIREELLAGQKIEAIKQYRATTGVGLTEAKTAVDKIEGELRASSPEKFTKQPSGKGCFGIVLIMGVMLVAIVLILAIR
jgi:hypothetical protein